MWKYDDGKWLETDALIEFFDEDGEPLDAPSGYSPRTRWFGIEGQMEIEVYSADPESEWEAPAPYLVMVYNVGDNIERILVNDFPSLLQLINYMIPVLSMPNREWEPEEEPGEEPEAKGKGSE